MFFEEKLFIKIYCFLLNLKSLYFCDYYFCFELFVCVVKFYFGIIYMLRFFIWIEDYDKKVFGYYKV